MSLFPLPPAEVDPGLWPEMLLYASTILLEAEGEPDPGPLGVGFVIRNRMDQVHASIRAVILGADGLAQGDGRPWEGFSCFNDDYVEQRKARLTAPDPGRWERAWRAACSAYWHLVPDPTFGAWFYLNPELTRKIRPKHDLPPWYDPARVTIRINKHEFLTLG